ncbi:MAG TPA: Gfo/Idh/MocA family oxidoreductase [Chloroflexi bacterium]|nr:Gfo/Idh/MocA family oxidoreductase [Chloroflexota bacterium]
MLTKDAQRLRIGVLGAGPISQFAHLDATRKARNADLVAICDAAEDLLARMAAVHQPTRTYTDYAAMLADPEIDAVIIGVADQFHVALAQQALAAGKHVLVEKPLGVSVEECEALRASVATTQLVLQVGNNRRFDPGVAFARTFIHEQMGQVMALKAWYYDSFYRYTMTDNLQPIPQLSAQARRPAGNPKADKQRYFMLTHGSHLVDTARFLAGEIVQVQARFIQRFDAYGWFVAVDFASGALGHLDLIIPIQGDFEEGFQVFGEQGSVVARGYLPWYHKSSHVECFSARDRQYHRVLGEDSYTYKLQIEGFADAILHGKPQQGATVEDGVAAMRAMVAIARSVESGAPVQLAEVSGGV